MPCSGSMFHLPMPLRKWLFYSFLASGVTGVCPLLGKGFAFQQPTPSQEVVFTFLFWRWRSLAMRASPVGCSPDDLTKTKTKIKYVSTCVIFIVLLELCGFGGLLHAFWTVLASLWWQVGCTVSPPACFMVPGEGYIIDSGTKMATK